MELVVAGLILALVPILATRLHPLEPGEAHIAKVMATMILAGGFLIGVGVGTLL